LEFKKRQEVVVPKMEERDASPPRKKLRVKEESKPEIINLESDED